MAGGVTYDTGALIAAEAGQRDLWALHATALKRGVRPVVPANVLAQAWRGGAQVQLSRLLRGCRIEELDEPLARAAGTALGLAGTTDVTDAVVVVGALRRNDLVVTSDIGDIIHLATVLGQKLRTHAV